MAFVARFHRIRIAKIVLRRLATAALEIPPGKSLLCIILAFVASVPYLLLVPRTEAAVPTRQNATVVAGRATAGTAESPLTHGATVPSGVTLHVVETLVVHMPDGTLARLLAGSEAAFDGLTDSTKFSLRLTSGEIALDASQRPADISPLRFELRTPLHTVVSFRALVGVIIVDADRERIACERCGRGDFVVSSFDKSLALSEPGQVAIVTADGGLFGGVLATPPAALDAATLRQWVLRSVAITVRSEHGDQPAVDACTHVPFDLRIVGGRPPYTVASADANAVDVTSTMLADVFRVTPAASTSVTIVDADQRSAAVHLHSIVADRCSAPLPAGPQ